MNIQTSEAIIGALPTIESEMSALEQHITEYRAALNQEGIWLFLATLGCWSVTHPLLQFFAFALALVLFGHRVIKRVGEKRSFSKLVKAIEERITTILPDGDSQKARLYDLAAFQGRELSALNSLRTTGDFLLCWLFYGASLLQSMFHLAPAHG
jgi:hypothetical protein